MSYFSEFIQQQLPTDESASDVLRKNRQAVGRHLDQVLMQALTPRQGLNRWPVLSGTDPSIDIAYMALMHLEADEDRHRDELFYIDAQLDLLAQMADRLNLGEGIPPVLCQQYQQQPNYTGHWGDQRLLWQPLLEYWQQLKRGWHCFQSNLRRLIIS